MHSADADEAEYRLRIPDVRCTQQLDICMNLIAIWCVLRGLPQQLQYCCSGISALTRYTHSLCCFVQLLSLAHTIGIYQSMTEKL